METEKLIKTYFCDEPRGLPISKLDTSITCCFYIRDDEEF